MKQSEPIRFIRIFHRWSGALLIIFLITKILSGLSAAGYTGLIPAQFHGTPWVDVPLLFLFIGHSLYGLYKMIQSLFKNKILLFMCFNFLGLFLFVGSLFLFGIL